MKIAIVQIRREDSLAETRQDESMVELLESYPLYRKCRCTISDKVYDLELPAVHMYCPTCKADHTFTMSNSFEDQVEENCSPAGLTFAAVYTCASCQISQRHFLLHFAEDLGGATKVGQFPSWGPKIGPAMKGVLGTHEDEFKKGLDCESVGYGIGAAAYYRRIVDDIVDELLVRIESLLELEQQKKYAEALRSVSDSKVAKDKIELVKDLLPSNLRPASVNPLSTLHEELSKGLHSMTDEECLESAESIRHVLVFLVEQVTQHKEASSRFSEHMKILLDRKSKPQEKRGHSTS
jgi:hypothetical protein